MIRKHASSKPRAFYGIDLGTTHTVVVRATQNMEGQFDYAIIKIDNEPLDEFDDTFAEDLLPSVVYYPPTRPDRPVIGYYAIDAYRFDPDNVYFNEKMNLGKQMILSEIHKHTPQEVTQAILKKCIAAIYKDSSTGYKPAIRVSVPAAFSQDKRDDTMQAARNVFNELGIPTPAGRNPVLLYDEPQAAFANFIKNEPEAIKHLHGQDTVLLCDIGGGTCDIQICDITYDPKKSKELYIDPFKYKAPIKDEFAGANFDVALMKTFMKQFWNYYNIPLQNARHFSQLKQLEKILLMNAKDVKENLCDKDDPEASYEQTLVLDTVMVEQLKKLLKGYDTKDPFVLRMTKKEMDTVFYPLLYIDEESDQLCIQSIINSYLRDNYVGYDDISCVYLTGGMALYDGIAQAIRDLLKKPVVIARKPLFCTAMGIIVSSVLAYGDYAQKRQVYEKEKKELGLDATHVSLVDHTALEDRKVVGAQSNKLGTSFFLDVENDFPTRIISDEDVYPCDYRQTDVDLKTTSPTHLSLVLFEGRSNIDPGLRILRKKSVEFEQIIPIGSPITIAYSISEDKIITIYATVEDHTYTLKSVED